MGTLTNERRSHVETVRDWPRGTRRRGFGFLHDQVWFPAPIKADVFGNEAVPSRPERIRIKKFGGKWHELYLDRKMLWTPFGSLRFHTFHMGDDDGAPHDHPWAFVTFPLSDYTETVQKPIVNRTTSDLLYTMSSRLVKRWRFHFRRAAHRHFVHEPDGPIRTIILTGRARRDWAFYPNGRRVPHREWTNYNREVES